MSSLVIGCYLFLSFLLLLLPSTGFPIIVLVVVLLSVVVVFSVRPAVRLSLGMWDL